MIIICTVLDWNTSKETPSSVTGHRLVIVFKLLGSWSFFFRSHIYNTTLTAGRKQEDQVALHYTVESELRTVEFIKYM